MLKILKQPRISKRRAERCWAKAWQAYETAKDRWQREGGPPPRFNWHPDTGARIARPARPDLIIPLEKIIAGDDDGAEGRTLDRRDEIAKRPRSTAGPPRNEKRPLRFQPEEAQNPELNSGSNSHPDLIRHRKNSQAEFPATDPRALGGRLGLLLVDDADLIFARKSNALWWFGPRDQFEFFQIYTLGNSRRHAFEAALDEFLEHRRKRRR